PNSTLSKSPLARRCTKIRAELTNYLDQLSKAQRRASGDFDKVEFGPGGNLQKLIAAFLIGG
ncbi:MAG: DUF922 domain-containing protein, partial [Mesorhizobium sp.]